MRWCHHFCFVKLCFLKGRCYLRTTKCAVNPLKCWSCSSNSPNRSLAVCCSLAFVITSWWSLISIGFPSVVELEILLNTSNIGNSTNSFCGSLHFLIYLSIKKKKKCEKKEYNSFYFWLLSYLWLNFLSHFLLFLPPPSTPSIWNTHIFFMYAISIFHF